MTRLICKGPKVTVVEGDVEDAEGEGTAWSRGQLMRRRLNSCFCSAETERLCGLCCWFGSRSV